MKVYVFILILVFAIILLFLWQYVFSIYEVFYKIEPKDLYVTDSVIKIESVPLNALGFRAPFRESPFNYEWESGSELVEVVEDNSDSGYLILKSTGTTGMVVLRVKSKYALLASIVEIRILANLTDNKQGIKL